MTMPDPLLPYRATLADTTRHAYARHRDSAVAEDWLAAGVWGAVFLEAFLDESLAALGIVERERDLGGLINKHRPVKTLPNQKSALDLCETIRTARNRVVHVGAGSAQAVDSYGKVIAETMSLFLDLTQNWPLAAGTARPQAAQPAATVGRVFLSTITPHLQVQTLFLEDLRAAMRQRGLEPVTVYLDKYDQKDPMRKVLIEMRQCDACLCFGLERSHAYLLCEREGSDAFKEMVHGFYSSSWLNIEAGAGFALGLPVLALCEAHIHSDGIFDRGWNSATVYAIDSKPPSVFDGDVQQCLNRLLLEVKAHKAAKA